MDFMKKSHGTPVMVAAGPKDKENFASPDVFSKNKKSPKSFKGTKRSLSLKSNNKNIEMIKNQLNNLTSERKVHKQITAHDLTSNESPGEAYWEQLSESRRIALESTLKENAGLHSKIMELEYENTRLKATLAEAQTSIRLLTELLEDGEEETDDIDDPFEESDQDLDESTASTSSI